MHKILAVDSEKCTGCGICELICSALKDRAFNRRLSRIRVVSLEPKIDVPMTCRFCENPACVRSCPRNALRQSREGAIIVDSMKCNGCGWCIEACDFGTIFLHKENGVIMVCDLCDGQPKCVDWCPTGSLRLITPHIVADKARIETVKKLFHVEG